MSVLTGLCLPNTPAIHDSTLISFTEIQSFYDTLISLNEKLRDQVSFERDKKLAWLGSEHYHKEFATISCNLGKQTGKTEYIKNKLLEGSSVCFVNNDRERNATYKDFTNSCFTIPKTYQSFRGLKLPKGLKYIFIDNASWFDYSVIYDIISNTGKEYTIICLG